MGTVPDCPYGSVGKGQKMKDFFVSYAKQDRLWAEWIAAELEAHGYSAIVQARDFRPGESFTKRMHDSLRLSRQILAVISPDYLTSQFAEAEWQSAFAEDPTGDKRRLLPVRVRDCTPQGLLTSRIYVDLVGLTETEARTTLLSAITATQPDHADPDRSPRTATDALQRFFPGRDTGPGILWPAVEALATIVRELLRIGPGLTELKLRDAKRDVAKIFFAVQDFDAEFEVFQRNIEYAAKDRSDTHLEAALSSLNRFANLAREILYLYDTIPSSLPTRLMLDQASPGLGPRLYVLAYHDLYLGAAWQQAISEALSQTASQPKRALGRPFSAVIRANVFPRGQFALPDDIGPDHRLNEWRHPLSPFTTEALLEDEVAKLGVARATLREILRDLALFVKNNISGEDLVA